LSGTPGVAGSVAEELAVSDTGFSTPACFVAVRATRAPCPEIPLAHALLPA